jgi:hypothetical protein
LVSQTSNVHEKKRKKNGKESEGNDDTSRYAGSPAPRTVNPALSSSSLRPTAPMTKTLVTSACTLHQSFHYEHGVILSSLDLHNSNLEPGWFFLRN